MPFVRPISLAIALSLITSFEGKRVSVDEAKELMLDEDVGSPTQLTCCWFESGYDRDSAQKLCYVNGTSCTNRQNHDEGKLARFESCSMLCRGKDDKVVVNLKDNKVFVSLAPSLFMAEDEQERAPLNAVAGKEVKEKAEEASAAQKPAAEKAVAEKVAAEKGAAEKDEADKAVADQAEPENTAPQAPATEAAKEGAEAAPAEVVAAEVPRSEAAPTEDGAAAPKPKVTESSAIRVLPFVALLAPAAIAI